MSPLDRDRVVAINMCLLFEDGQWSVHRLTSQDGHEPKREVGDIVDHAFASEVTERLTCIAADVVVRNYTLAVERELQKVEADTRRRIDAAERDRMHAEAVVERARSILLTPSERSQG